MVQNSKMKTIGKGLLSWAAVIVLVVSVIIFTIIRGTAFFSVNNLMNILRSMSVVTIFALAATVSMAPDGFDMSAGTLGTFSAYVFAALFLWFGAPLWLAIVLTIAFTMIMYLLTMFLILVCKIRICWLLCITVCACWSWACVYRWKCCFGRSECSEMVRCISWRRYYTSA